MGEANGEHVLVAPICTTQTQFRISIVQDPMQVVACIPAARADEVFRQSAESHAGRLVALGCVDVTVAAEALKTSPGVYNNNQGWEF